MEFINNGSGWVTWFFSQTSGSIVAFKLSKPADPEVFKKLHGFFKELLQSKPASVEIQQEGARHAQLKIKVRPLEDEPNAFGHDALIQVSQYLPGMAVLSIDNLPINSCSLFRTMLMRLESL